jgi:hypothetical protein
MLLMRLVKTLTPRLHDEGVADEVAAHLQRGLSAGCHRGRRFDGRRSRLVPSWARDQQDEQNETEQSSAVVRPAPPCTRAVIHAAYSVRSLAE